MKRVYNLEILERWLDTGLVGSAGNGRTTACVEQAVALCAGIGLTDRPDSCVDPHISAFGRGLNDWGWSSNRARSDGLRAFAYAQLGTADEGFDSERWGKRTLELAREELMPFFPASGNARDEVEGYLISMEARGYHGESAGGIAALATKLPRFNSCRGARDILLTHAANIAVRAIREQVPEGEGVACPAR